MSASPLLSLTAALLLLGGAAVAQPAPAETPSAVPLDVPDETPAPSDDSITSALGQTDGGIAPDDIEPVPAVMAPLAQSSLINGAVRVGPRIVAVGQWGHILLSDDDGGHWRQVAVPVDVTLTAVRFVDQRLGFAVGHDATILRTEDGGQSWALVNFDPAAQAPLMDIRMADRISGFAVGAYGLVMTTGDGGRSWTRKDMGDLDWHLNGTARGPDGRIWIAGEAGNIFVTDPGLGRFTTLETGYAGSFWNVLCLDDGTVIAFGMRGTIRRSTDGGQSWQQVANGLVASLESGLVLDDGRIVLVGLEGTILVSRDKGRSFAPVARPGREGLTAALPRGDGTLLVFGVAGVSPQPLTN